MSSSCKYSNVQSFLGVKPYCDLGAKGAKGRNRDRGVGEWVLGRVRELQRKYNIYATTLCESSLKR